MRTKQQRAWSHFDMSKAILRGDQCMRQPIDNSIVHRIENGAVPIRFDFSFHSAQRISQQIKSTNEGTHRYSI